MQLCMHTVIKTLCECSKLNILKLLPVTFDWGQSLQRRNSLVIDEVIVLFGWIKPAKKIEKHFNIYFYWVWPKVRHLWSYIKIPKLWHKTCCSLSPDNVHGESQGLLHAVRLTLVVPRQEFSFVKKWEHACTPTRTRTHTSYSDSKVVLSSCLPWPAWWLHWVCPRSSAGTPAGGNRTFK